MHVLHACIIQVTFDRGQLFALTETQNAFLVIQKQISTGMMLGVYAYVYGIHMFFFVSL